MIHGAGIASVLSLKDGVPSCIGGAHYQYLILHCLFGTLLEPYYHRIRLHHGAESTRSMELEHFLTYSAVALSILGFAYPAYTISTTLPHSPFYEYMKGIWKQ